jgi:acyl carrier protein
MERQELFDTVRQAAVEMLEVDSDAVKEDARFKEDLDVDSLDVVEFVMALEDQLEIRIPEDELEGVATVGQALDLVMSKLSPVR